MLVRDDGRVERGVGADLGILGHSACLLTAGARNGVEVRIAVDRRAGRIDDGELELIHCERTTDWPGRAGGRPASQDRNGRESNDADPHLILRCSTYKTRCGTQ